MFLREDTFYPNRVGEKKNREKDELKLVTRERETN